MEFIFYFANVIVFSCIYLLLVALGETIFNKIEKRVNKQKKKYLPIKVLYTKTNFYNFVIE